MATRKAFLQILCIVMLATLGLATGCTDAFTGYDEVADTPARTAYDGPKFRHAHLLKRALKTSDAAGKSSSATDQLGLIVGVQPGIDKQRVLERYRLFDRFRVLERYRIFDRFEYDHVLYGFAWVIEDSLGGDFQPLFDLLTADPDINFFETDIPTRQGPRDAARQGSSGSQKLPKGVGRIGGSGHNADGVEVFVLDTGVSNNDVNVVESVDFTDSPSGTTDIDGHGTHIAGTIAALDDTDGVIGVAPAARIHSLKVVPDTDPNPDDGEVDLSTAIAAVEYATGQKLANPNIPMVVNISLGADIGTTAYNALDEAIEASSAAGVVYVVAAGNYGAGASTVTPAHAASAITVGAYDPETDQFAPFSNYGSAVDILAPGIAVESLDKGNGPDEIVMSGTSTATGHVTGAVALFLADNPQASAAQVAAALAASGDAVIQGVPANTTNKTVRVAELLEMQLPPFFHYAVLSGQNVTIKGDAYLGVEGANQRNANVFANQNFTVDGTTILSEGFAYYGGDAGGPMTSTFLPRYNPMALPVHMHAAPIDVPRFEAADYRHLATVTTGSINLSGHYDLGTRDHPVIWYVGGNLKTAGDVTFSGYGVFLIKNDIEFKHDVTAETSSGETTLAFYAGNNLRFKSSDLTVSAQLFVDNDFTFDGNNTLYGSVTAYKNVKLDGTTRIYYRPASPALTNPFWPMNGTN